MSKTKKPLVSIITVVYNGEKYLEQTIQSVIKQTYENIEYIIVDGGSTDGTLDIIKKYEKNISKWVSEPDEGLYDAMNKGIRMANGELIGMINSDDWYETDAVETMVKAYLEHPSKHIFHADRYDIKEDGSRAIKKFHPSVFKFKYYGMTYNHPSMFITKKEYEKHLYNTKLKALSDYQFVLEAFLRDPNIFQYIEKPIVNYRLEGVSAQMHIKEKLEEGFAARKNADMNLYENIFSVIFRFIIATFYKLKGTL
ncbi:glycosyltransferase family 2 protein [Hydrogenimonas urashimensis]|uniref:glycosyltransferase family 2 protein n=1 Tax=Hydrogenimonas urashimensis TaxID=2740515 RepID=UPI001F1DA425|nr:glycosyltransferase family 2 protein [Hydrogenimonas urashimensis]